MHPDGGSFRDPAGRVFWHGEKVLRTVSRIHREEWEHQISSGLLREAVDRGLMLPFSELPEEAWPDIPGGREDVWKLLSAETIPLLSWPYEWCFGQLKAAALLTLDMQELALGHGCILKDASAYNVQFLNGRPIFIDLLSFERWKEGQPWQAYGQFCSHFLAPLALTSLTDIRCGRLSNLWVQGIPLDLACTLLPLRTKFVPGLFLHLHLHASLQRKHAGDGRQGGSPARETKLTLRGMRDTLASLRSAVDALRPPRQATEWGDYYQDTNYTPAAAAEKERIVSAVAAAHAGGRAADLGANNGRHSALLAPHFSVVASTDIDPAAVEQHYASSPDPRILPLILDLANPSPGIGWDCAERASFAERCRADFLLALALCHHLVITGGIPLPQVASGFASLLAPGGTALVEFVPREDSQLQRMLATRDDIFADYDLDHFLKGFAEAGFRERERFPLPESVRTLHVLEKA